MFLWQEKLFFGIPLVDAYGHQLPHVAFDGQHLGWWERGWVRDHRAHACSSQMPPEVGYRRRQRQASPAKGYKNTPPAPPFQHLEPRRSQTA
jgi:hypothetical protein